METLVKIRINQIKSGDIIIRHGSEYKAYIIGDEVKLYKAYEFGWCGHPVRVSIDSREFVLLKF